MDRNHLSSSLHARPAAATVTFAGFRLEADGSLFRGDTLVHLAPKELAALRLLLSNAGQIVTPVQLKQNLWGEIHVTADSIPKCLSSLRARLEPEDCIQTVYKRGYRLTAEVRPQETARNTSLQRVAILPFATEFAIPEHLGPAIAEETIARLSNDPDPVIAVLARDSVFTLAARGLSALEIGNTLHADLVLTGTLRSLPAQYRLRVEMIQVSDGAQVWVEDMIVERARLASLESDLVHRLAYRLGDRGLSISAVAEPLPDPASAPRRREAYDHFLRGRYEWQSLERHRMQDGLQHLLRANELDPALIAARVDLAHLCVTQALYGFMSPNVAAGIIRRTADLNGQVTPPGHTPGVSGSRAATFARRASDASVPAKPPGRRAADAKPRTARFGRRAADAGFPPPRFGRRESDLSSPDLLLGRRSEDAWTAAALGRWGEDAEFKPAPLGRRANDLAAPALAPLRRVNEHEPEPAQHEPASDYELLAAHAEQAQAILPALGWVNFHVDHDLPAALRAFAKSAHLPHNPWITRTRAHFALSRHRFDDAISLLRGALELDPYSPWLHARLAWTYHLAGQPDESLKCIRNTIAQFPMHESTHIYGASLLAYYGDTEPAVKLAQELARRLPYFDLAMAVHAYALACAGRAAEAGAILDRLQWLSRERFVLNAFIPAVHVVLGNHDAALAELRTSAESRCPWFFQMLADPRLQPLHSRPEFNALQSILTAMEASTEIAPLVEP